MPTSSDMAKNASVAEAASPEAIMDWLRSVHPQPHPILPTIPFEEAILLLEHAEGREVYADWLRKHQRRLRKAEEDELHHGFEPPCWADADRELERDDVDIQANFGANRSSKSWRAGKRICEAALAYPYGQHLVLGETDDSSKRTQQMIVWHFLRPHIEHLNRRQHPVFKVNYSEANGFTEGTLVLPNHTLIQFDTYRSEPGKYEGWEFGARLEELQDRPDGTPVLNLGVWADESMTLAWLTMVARRVRFRKAKMLWTFTPMRGITPAVKEFLGVFQTQQSRPALLLPNAQIPGCARGQMPYIVKPAFPRSSGIYFHIDQIVFGGYEAILRENCQGRPTEYVERIAYGFARDSVARALPSFGPWNQVRVENIPARGTLYQFLDPHGERNYAVIWVLVTPGSRPDYYIVRDWPDEQTYGEWATPTEREVTEDTRKGWDGDPGPAQNSLGWGVARYKRMFAEKEAIPVAPELQRLVRGWADRLPEPAQIDALLAEHIRRPWHRPIVRQAILERGDLTGLREPVWERFMDARFAETKHATEHGGTCLLWQFTEESLDPETGQTLGRLDFRKASGQIIEHGLSLLNDLLDWKSEAPLVPGINAPRLYVSEECHQVIWGFSNYTGRAGDKGACKEWIDLGRHLAEEQPLHLEPGRTRTRGGGSY